MTFDELLAEHRLSILRYVRFRIGSAADTEDVLQEVFAAAAAGFSSLRDAASAKAWLVGIARNKCADFLRRKYRRPEVPLEHAEQLAVSPARLGLARDSLVQDVLERLSGQDQQVLRLYYWQELPLQEIAHRLGVPLGTVKRRLHHARERFRAAWPVMQKGENNMQTIMPKRLPDYTITPIPLPPFQCKWEEMMGWFIVPRMGEKLSWAMYDFPDRVRTEADELTVTGRAMVHGIEGVEIQVRTFDPMSNNQTGDDDRYVQRSFVAQLTDTHCRILSETHEQGGVRYVWTFLDGESFLDNWGFGPDNCGNETNLAPRGVITREGSVLTADPAVKDAMDMVGRYTVAINGKVYDTVCVIMHETYQGGMLSEQFIDQHGRTVLWRRFNADDWQLEQRGKRWTELLPGEETLTVNGRTYVHWYDCITSYIL